MDALTLGILVALSFLPPIAFALWVRNHERHQREPLMAVLGMFVYGGSLGVIAAIILSFALGYSLGVDLGAEGGQAAFLGVVVIAPFAEELCKGLGLGFVSRRIDELEDGIIYGAAIGLGFAATENFLYGVASLNEDGLETAILTISLRVVSSALLHAGTSALLGYGYGLAKLRGQGLLPVLPFYLLAVAQHGLYNYLVSAQYLVAFGAALAMVIIVFTILRRQVRRLDAQPRQWAIVR